MAVLVVVLACGGPAAREPRSFEAIQRQAVGKTARDLAKLLGDPDERQPLPAGGGDTLLWRNCVRLEGEHFPPELRHQVMHLVVVLKRPAARGGGGGGGGGGAPRLAGEPRVADVFDVSYSRPAAPGE